MALRVLYVSQQSADARRPGLFVRCQAGNFDSYFLLQLRLFVSGCDQRLLVKVESSEGNADIAVGVPVIGIFHDVERPVDLGIGNLLLHQFFEETGGVRAAVGSIDRLVGELCIAQPPLVASQQVMQICFIRMGLDERVQLLQLRFAERVFGIETLLERRDISVAQPRRLSCGTKNHGRQNGDGD